MAAGSGSDRPDGRPHRGLARRPGRQRHSHWSRARNQRNDSSALAQTTTRPPTLRSCLLHHAVTGGIPVPACPPRRCPRAASAPSSVRVVVRLPLGPGRFVAVRRRLRICADPTNVAALTSFLPSPHHPPPSPPLNPPVRARRGLTVTAPTGPGLHRRQWVRHFRSRWWTRYADALSWLCTTARRDTAPAWLPGSLVSGRVGGRWLPRCRRKERRPVRRTPPRGLTDRRERACV